MTQILTYSVDDEATTSRPILLLLSGRLYRDKNHHSLISAAGWRRNEAAIASPTRPFTRRSILKQRGEREECIGQDRGRVRGRRGSSDSERSNPNSAEVKCWYTVNRLQLFIILWVDAAVSLASKLGRRDKGPARNENWFHSQSSRLEEFSIQVQQGEQLIILEDGRCRSS